MSAKISLQNTCNSILNNIRNSCLNYAVQETPFSIYITLRKTEVKFKQNTSNFHSDCVQLKSEKASVDEVTKIEKAYNELKDDFVDALKELETKNEHIKRLEDTVENYDEKLSKFPFLEEQFQEINAENKKLEQQIVASHKELENAKNRLIDTKKISDETLETNKNLLEEIKCLKAHNDRLETSTKRLNSQMISNQTKTKKEKDELIKETKVEVKELKTDLGQERKKALKLEKELEHLKRQVHKPSETKATNTAVSPNLVSISCQTDPHPELPYEITSPLPPIFSSQFCHHTPRIRFWSRSLPKLESVDWWNKTEADLIEEEVAEYEANLHDREIAEFYENKQDQARAVRAINLPEWWTQVENENENT